jgi:phosphoenolpyruvate phosphomutase
MSTMEGQLPSNAGLGFASALATAAERHQPLRAIGAANAVAARVAAEAGLDALWVSGLETSASLGLPDENVIGPRELSDVVAALRRVSYLPLIVDVDNAGGSVPGARRVAFDLSGLGISALCIEDSAYPKINSFALNRGQRLADERVVSRQLLAMREVAHPEIAIIARTEALIAGRPLEEALGRATAYVSAGADAIVMHSRDPTGQETFDAASAWSGEVPLITIPTAFPQFTGKDFASAGFALIVYANQLSRAALAAMRAAAAELAHEDRFGAGPTSVPLARVEDLLRIGDRASRATT